MSGRRILVVNGDDYGLTPGVCDGILRAHRDGIVTSTSVLAPAPAFPGHAAALRDSGLAAGLHLCVVGEDPPLLSATEVPTLVDRRGRFPISWRVFVRRAARGLVDPGDLAREFEAQHSALRAAGITATHVDSHQNLHLWPSVSTVAIDLAVRHRIPVMRITRTRKVGPVGLGVRALSSRLARAARDAGLVVPDLAAGLDTAGAVDEAALRSIISWFGARTGHADLAVHPGSDPDPDRARYRWGYSWGGELRALCADGLTSHVERSGMELGSFRDLAAAGAPTGGGA